MGKGGDPSAEKGTRGSEEHYGEGRRQRGGGIFEITENRDVV